MDLPLILPEKVKKSEIRLATYHLDFPTHNQAMPVGIDEETGEVYVPVVFFPGAEVLAIKRAQDAEPMLMADKVMLCRAAYVLAQPDLKDSVRRAVNTICETITKTHQLDRGLDPTDPSVPLTPDELKGSWIKH